MNPITLPSNYPSSHLPTRILFLPCTEPACIPCACWKAKVPQPDTRLLHCGSVSASPTHSTIKLTSTMFHSPPRTFQPPGLEWLCLFPGEAYRHLSNFKDQILTNVPLFQSFCLSSGRIYWDLVTLISSSAHLPSQGCRSSDAEEWTWSLMDLGLNLPLLSLWSQAGFYL